MTRVLIIGATGRMGRALVRAARERPGLRIAAAVARSGSEHVGRDVGDVAGTESLGVPIVDELSGALAECDVAVDFSQPAAAAANLAACVAAGRALLLGTTGLPAELHPELDRAARHIAVLQAANTSLGVTLLLELVRRCAEVLPLKFDAEIIEAHHRHKKDAPSGTAWALAQAIAHGRGQSLEEVAALDRTHGGARAEGEIGFAVVRGGDLVGEHTVMFAGPGEQVILGHRATDRGIFAAGALDAAAWLARQAPGRYSMRDIIL